MIPQHPFANIAEKGSLAMCTYYITRQKASVLKICENKVLGTRSAYFIIPFVQTITNALLWLLAYVY